MSYYVYKGKKNEYVCGIPFITGGIYEIHLEDGWLSRAISAKIVNPMDHFQVATIPYSSLEIFSRIWERVTPSNNNIEMRNYATRI